ELELAGVQANADRVAAYARVCGFSLRDALPPTYPHVLAFPLHMAVMADGGFPFGAVGLVHVENRIEQRRPISIGAELTIRVRPTKLKDHPRGRTFSLLTKVLSDRQIAWESTSTMLRRSNGQQSADGPKIDLYEGKSSHRQEGWLKASSEWRLGGDLGRRY